MRNIILLLITSFIYSQKLIIPMDQSQNNHLKAYGVVYSILNKHDLAIRDYKEALKKNNTCFAKSYILEKIEKQYIDKFKNS